MTIEKPTLKFTPEWEFLNDPEIKQIQIFLDESFFSTKKKEERDAALKYFEEGMEKLMGNLPTIAKSNPNRLGQILLFVRTNMRILDKGGMSTGRSQQHNVLVKINKCFFDNYKDLWNEITNKE
jgi:hypothetical protein